MVLRTNRTEACVCVRVSSLVRRMACSFVFWCIFSKTGHCADGTRKRDRWETIVHGGPRTQSAAPIPLSSGNKRAVHCSLDRKKENTENGKTPPLCGKGGTAVYLFSCQKNSTAIWNFRSRCFYVAVCCLRLERERRGEGCGGWAGGGCLCLLLASLTLLFLRKIRVRISVEKSFRSVETPISTFSKTFHRSSPLPFTSTRSRNRVVLPCGAKKKPTFFVQL